MKNKRVKQMICDVMNYADSGTNKNFKYVWDDGPCLVCFKSTNFLWASCDTVSLTSDQHKAIK